MTDDPDPPEETPKASSKKPLLFGFLLALVLGGAGFYAVYSGMILADGQNADATHDTVTVEPLPEVAFVPIDPLVINLGQGSTSRHLKFRAQLEVNPPHQEEVTELLPRVLDVLNGYLRAIDIGDIEERTALIRLRSQMLRRVQMVTGEGRVRDLLIMEFVLN